eukprot:31499-Pelagococcus_subviridis.AAC.4
MKPATPTLVAPGSSSCVACDAPRRVGRCPRAAGVSASSPPRRAWRGRRTTRPSAAASSRRPCATADEIPRLRRRLRAAATSGLS